jgi:hypothetical protein
MLYCPIIWLTLYRSYKSVDATVSDAHDLIMRFSCAASSRRPGSGVYIRDAHFTIASAIAALVIEMTKCAEVFVFCLKFIIVLSTLQDDRRIMQGFNMRLPATIVTFELIQF